MFNYFLPGKTKQAVAPGDKLVHAELPAMLADVLADVRRVPTDASVLDVKTGPNGKAGCVISVVRKYSGPPDVHYDPNYQSWEKSFPDEPEEYPERRYWLGVRHGESLSVKALERLEIVPGAEIRDDQGHEWTVPIARAPAYPTGTLPQSFGFRPDGEPVSKVLGSYFWLWDLASQLREWYRPDDEPAEGQAPPPPRHRHPLEWLVKSAARILAVNYRLGPAELNWLNAQGTPVMTSATVHAICQAAYGFEAFVETKKNSPEENSSPATN